MNASAQGGIMVPEGFTTPGEATNVPTIPLPPPKPVMKFHVGIRPGGPAWHTNIAGVCFPQTTSFYDDQGTEYKKSGTICELDVETLRKVRDGIRSRIVRWRYGLDRKTNTRRRLDAEIWDSKTFGFRASVGDEPLEPYLIFEKVSEEFSQPIVAGEVTKAIDDAIQGAERSEARALSDPKDARLRERHGQLKAMAAKVDPTDLVT